MSIKTPDLRIKLGESAEQWHKRIQAIALQAQDSYVDQQELSPELAKFMSHQPGIEANRAMKTFNDLFKSI